MSLRVCFFGNSHIAALREAWRDDAARWPGLEPSFVGAHKDLLLKTVHRNGRLVPSGNATADAFRRLGGVEDVDLGAFDAFVVTGCLISVATAANTYRDCRWVGLPSLEAKHDLAAGPERLLSYAAARASMQAAMATRLGPKFVTHLRAMTDKPILLTSQPRVSAAIKAKRRSVTRAHHTALSNGDAEGLSAIFEDAAARVIAECGARFVPQPAPTIEDHILTALPYMNGAKRLTARGNLPQPKDDIMHANAAYGALVIDQVVSTLGDKGSA
ncbi:hypothetical protein [Flavimaricola marinus]|uniref:Uncharacterized protein n=1 Tax=Flavimaricola marinus TaxID=1819565 RepID=A0A238LGH4_9RHOB|nr:hypothetical protein [Flavimaricola marinus]SMY08672.1 hypothetical protein LOM8899_02827 [Flavimaricola marinus]